MQHCALSCDHCHSLSCPGATAPFMCTRQPYTPIPNICLRPLTTIYPAWQQPPPKNYMEKEWKEGGEGQNKFIFKQDEW
jgi:hypothetical protein